MSNGSTIDVTRNYTYFVGAEKGSDGTQQLLRYQWTQSIPMEAALPVHRDCFIFDYQTKYRRGPFDVSTFEPPAGEKCSASPVSRASSLNNPFLPTTPEV